MTPCLSPRQVRGFARRCGRCASCVSYERARWVSRVRVEVAGRKAWAVTLTYRGSVEPDYSEVQKAMKRFRKAGHVGRYFAVLERGSLGGRWHCHLILVTEATRRQLEACWHRGFVHARLVRSAGSAAGYAAKYLRKTDARPKSSVGFGSRPVADMCVRLAAVSAVFGAFPRADVVSYQGVKLFAPARKLVKEKLTSKNSCNASPPLIWSDDEIALARKEMLSDDHRGAMRDRMARSYLGGPYEPV